MEDLIFDPSGSGSIGDYHGGCVGKTMAYATGNGSKITIRVDGADLYRDVDPEQCLDANGDPIGGVEDVLAYVQANFNKASVTPGQLNEILAAAENYTDAQIELVQSGVGNALTDTEPISGIHTYNLVGGDGTYTNFLSAAETPIQLSEEQAGSGEWQVYRTEVDGYWTLRRIVVDLGSAVKKSDVRMVAKGINLVDPSRFISDSYISTTSGAIASAAGYVRTDYFDLKEGVAHSLQGLPSISSKAIRFENASGAYVGHISVGAQPFSFTPPAGTVRGTVTVKRPQDAAPTAFMINEGAAKAYEPFAGLVISEIEETAIQADVLKSGATMDGAQVATVTDLLDLRGKIVILKSGLNFFVRTGYSDTEDIVHKFCFTTDSATSNETFDFLADYIISKTAANSEAIYQAGKIIQASSDEVAPFNTARFGNIGEGHGPSAPRVTSTAHDKTSDDLMSLWEATDGKKFYLVSIIDNNTLQFVCQPYAIGGSPELYMDQNIAAGNLTHVSGATNTGTITVNFKTPTQQYPVHKNVALKPLLDGKTVTSDGVYAGNEFKVSCEYDIIDPPTVEFEVPFSYQSGDSWVRMSNIYDFQKNGTVLIRTTINFKRQKTLLYYYGTMFRKPPTTTYPRLFHFVPKSLPVSGVDYANIHEVTTNPSTANFLSSHRQRDDYPIDRHISLLADSGGAYKVGVAIGLSTDKGYTKRETREGISQDWEIASSAKVYPRAIMTYAAESQVLDIIAYRAYFDATKTGDATSVFSYNYGGATYLVIDTHGEKAKGFAKCPAELVGKSIVEIVESSEGFIPLSDTITESGLLFKSESENNYIILKIA